MLRTKGEPGTGNIVEAVRHMRKVQSQIRKVSIMSDDELMTEAKNLGAPFEILREIKRTGKLPVVNFAAGRCHSSRCCIDDGIGSRWRFRWVWYF